MDHLWVLRALICLCVAVNLNFSQNAVTHWASIASVDSDILTKVFFCVSNLIASGECMYVFVHSDVVPKQLQNYLIPLLREALCTKI